MRKLDLFCRLYALLVVADEETAEGESSDVYKNPHCAAWKVFTISLRSYFATT